MNRTGVLRRLMGQISGLVFCLAVASCASTPSVVKPGWAVPTDASTKAINGYPMAYRERGSGPVVVLVGGVMTDYRYWETQLDDWSGHYRVIALSQRHFFPEPWDGKGTDFTVPQHAKDLDAFIESLHEPVYLVGWSYGAHVAFEAARARPDLVRKLVLDEAPIDALVLSADEVANAVQVERAKRTAQYFETGDRDGGLRYAVDAINGPGVWASLPEARKQGLRDNAWTVVGIGLSQPERVTCEMFGSLKMPVLLVQGERTTPRFKQIVQAQSKCLPQASVATIPRAGHPNPAMNPAAFKDAVFGFLHE